MELHFSTDTVGSHTVVAVSGEVDLESADSFTTYALDAARQHGPDLVIDLSRVTFLDSTGLKALIRIQRACRKDGGSVTLSGATRPVAKVLTITGLTDAFPVHESVAAATGSLDGHATTAAMDGHATTAAMDGHGTTANLDGDGDGHATNANLDGHGTTANLDGDGHATNANLDGHAPSGSEDGRGTSERESATASD